MNTNERPISTAFWALRVCFGVMPIAAGLDKFVGLLADWESYLAPSVQGLLPVEPATFLALVGIVEIAVGVLVLTRFVRVGAILAGAWLALVAVQLVLAGALDVAVRDLVLAVAAFALVELHQARSAAGAASTALRDATPEPRRA